MILVVGGTGHLGRRVVRRLLADGHGVRVMARGAGEAAGLREAGAELRPGDIRAQRDVEAAMDGATACVSAAQGFAGPGDKTPESVDRDGNRILTDAAAAVGADVVMVSVVGAAPDHPLALHRMKWAAEEYLRGSGAGWTIVRGTVFAETWADILRGTMNASGRVQVFGGGRNPINFVSAEDVADAVVRAVEDPGLRGVVIEVGGPASLTLNELAHMIAPGREPRHVPRAALRVIAAVAGPVKPQLASHARAAVEMDTSDMTFDPQPTLRAYPWLPSRPITPGVLQD